MTIYRVFINGVLHSEHRNKGDALNAAYKHHNEIYFAYDKLGDVARRDQAGREQGVLASLIPAARKTSSFSRCVLQTCGTTIRRDNF